MSAHVLDPTYSVDAFDYTTLPAQIRPYVGGTAEQTINDVKAVIRHAMDAHPRSQQKRIGPSEIGTPCDHCLAAKLAGWERNDQASWLPTIGTAVHAWLEEAILRHGDGPNPNHTTGRRFLTEQTVMVGHIGDTPITGSCDLFDAVNGVVWDHTIVGKTSLDAARRSGPSDVYRTQINLYALGYVNAGHTVDHTVIAFMPRNAVSLDHGVFWSAPVDLDRAYQALERANAIDRSLTALAGISTDVRDAWITSQPRHPGCRDCQKYPDRPTSEAPTTLDDLAI